MGSSNNRLGDILLGSDLGPRVHESLVPKLHSQRVDHVHKVEGCFEALVLVEFAKAHDASERPHVVDGLHALFGGLTLGRGRRQGRVEAEEKGRRRTSRLLQKVGQFLFAHARSELHNAGELQQRLGIVGPSAKLVGNLAALFAVHDAANENVSDLRDGGRVSGSHGRVDELQGAQHIEALPACKPREEGVARCRAGVLARKDFDSFALKVRACAHRARREGDDRHAHEGELVQRLHQFSPRRLKTALHLGRHNSLDFRSVFHFLVWAVCGCENVGERLEGEKTSAR